MAALILPVCGGAGVAQPLSPRSERETLPGDALAPRDIIASVRAAGFNPLSRPVQRGAVYVVFAIDRYFMDVRVMVDARSGRVLSATRLAGALYGGPGYGGYEVLPGAPPDYLPPFGRLPLPRANDRATGAAAKEAPVATRAPSATPPAAPGNATRNPASHQQPTMVPVAPLE